MSRIYCYIHVTAISRIKRHSIRQNEKKKNKNERCLYAESTAKIIIRANVRSVWHLISRAHTRPHVHTYIHTYMLDTHSSWYILAMITLQHKLQSIHETRHAHTPANPTSVSAIVSFSYLLSLLYYKRKNYLKKNILSMR